MNVRNVKLFGRDITIQEEELVMPKYANIRGIVKKPSWWKRNKFKICSLIVILTVLGVALWFSLKKKICYNGHSGDLCEIYDACWENPCEQCAPIAPNSQFFICCGKKSLGLGCKFSKYKSASHALIELNNGSLAAGYENNTVVIWRDQSFNQSTTLYFGSIVKSLALLRDDVLASGACDSTIRIWNLSTAVNAKNLTGQQGCVNSLVSFEYLNIVYMISASYLDFTDEATIQIWNDSFDMIEKYQHHLGPVILAYNPLWKYLAISTEDKKIKLYRVSFKLLAEKELAHSQTIQAILVIEGDLIATGSNETKIKIWKKMNRTLELVATLDEHSDRVNTLGTLSNSSLISGSDDRTVKVWNKINDTLFVCVATLEHDYAVTSLLVVNGLIICGTGNGSVYIWNETSLEAIQKLSPHKSTVWSVVRLNKQSIATGSADQTIQIWRLSQENATFSFTFVKSLIGHAYPVYRMIVLRDGRLLSAGFGSSIYVWRQESFELVTILREHHTNTIFGLAVLENGRFISVSYDQRIVIWDGDSLSNLETTITKERIWSVAVMSNDLLVTGTETGSIKVWDTKSIDLMQYVALNHSDGVLSLAFFQLEYNDLLLLSGSKEATIKVWSMQTGKCIITLTGHKSSVLSLAQINLNSFASGSTDRTIKIWEYYTDSFKNVFKNVETIKESEGSILALASLNRTNLASSSADQTLRIYKKSIEIKQINELKGHRKSVQDIVVLDSDKFASCSGDRTILIWENSQIIQTLQGHTDYVYALEYSPVDKLLISSSKDTTIRLWQFKSTLFTYKATFYNHKGSVISLRLLPNKTLASGSCDNTIKIWCLTKLEEIKALKGHEGCVNVLTLMNSYLLSGSSDATIIIWNIQDNYRIVEILKSHQGSINSLVIMNNNNNIVSASSDKSIKVWSKFGILIQKPLAHDAPIYVIRTLKDGSIVTGSRDFTIKIWKKNKFNSLDLITTLTDHKGYVYILAVLSNSSLISGSDDKTVKIWNKINETYFVCVATLEHDHAVTSQLVLGSLIICGTGNGSISFWNETTLQITCTLNGHQRYVWSLVAINSQSIASGAEDGFIRIWRKENETSNFKMFKSLFGHVYPVYSLVVLKDGSLVSGGYSSRVIIWEKGTFILKKLLIEHTHPVYGLAVLENGNFISVSFDQSIVIWDDKSLKKIATLVDNNPVWSVAVSSDDTFITGNLMKAIKIWSYSSNYQVIKTLIGHQDEVLHLAVLNNFILISASRDKTIRVWDNYFHSFVTEAHSKAVLALKVFPNGTLISSSEDRTIKTWDTRRYILDKFLN